MSAISESLDMIATTLDAWLPEAPDAIINNNGALFYFKTFGKMGLKGKNNEPMGSIETLDGGKRISVDVKIVANPNVGFVAYDETVPIVEQDAMATAYFDWKFCYGNAPVAKAKLDLNSGTKFQKRKLITSIKEVAEASMINAIGTALWNTTDSDSLVGFPSLITDDGTGTVGGLSTSTYPNWKNQFVYLAVSHTPAQLVDAMGNLYRKCKVGADSPDLILVGSDLYAEFESTLVKNERYLRTEKVQKMADSGFEALSYKGAVVIYDENCPANRMYFVNSKAIGFYFHSADKFTIGAVEKKYGGMQYNFPLSSTCALVCKNRRMNGVLVVSNDTPTTAPETTAAESTGE